MSRKIKVIHLIDRVVPGGAENGILRRIDYIDKNKYEFQFCCLSAYNSYIYAFEKRGIPICSLGMKYRREISIIWRLIQFLRKEKPDILHTHFSYSDLYGVLAGKLVGVPILMATFHMREGWKMQKCLKHRLRMKVEKRTARWFDRIATVSVAVKRFAMYYQSIPDEKLTPIYNGIDTQTFKRIPSNDLKTQLNISPQDKIIGTTGRLSEEKGQRYIIQAMPLILERFPNTKFLLVGHGPLLKNLMELTKKLNVTDSVIMTGYREDIQELLSIMDIYILPSFSEGLPNSLLEAMACSLPSIGTNVSGIPELIDDGVSGFLIGPADERAIAEKVIYLFDHPDEMKQMGLAARQKIEDQFDIRVVSQNLQRIYDELVARKLNWKE